MDRDAHLKSLTGLVEPLDMLVIGGGATGASVALDAAARGYRIALLEQADFGKGTSSRSTKLIHGGVRYLAQGNISLVRESLRERARLRANAPHVVHELRFVIPAVNRLQRLWYRLGLWLYDQLAGTTGFRRSQSLTQAECLALAPTLNPDRARGGVLYSDGQFDDCRLLINLLQTAAEQTAIVINYAAVDGLVKDSQGRVNGAVFVDTETGISHRVLAKCVVNATGAFCDRVRQLDRADCQPIIAASQGVHLVLPRKFLPGQAAVIVPKTRDGRVIFLIPWREHLLVGTTDTAIGEPSLEPRPQPAEIDFLLETAGQYLTCRPTRADILSVFTGIRPLVARGNLGTRTAQLSRDHVIEATSSGLLTVTGGKWTTARKMGEDVVDRAIQTSRLTPRECRTTNLRIHGAPSDHGRSAVESIYGSDAALIESLAASDARLARPIAEGYFLRGAEVVWATRHEMARTVEDVLARRSRLLFLNARAAIAAAPRVAQWMAGELLRDDDWRDRQVREFSELAGHYLV
jgi:glycerol-3-phosphate dehydrogenase